MHHSDLTKGKTFKPHIIWLYRRLFWGILPLLSLFIGLNFLLNIFPLELVVSLGLVYSVVFFIYQRKIYQKLQLDISEEFLVKSTGLWNQSQVIIEIFKLQSISVGKPIWLKNRKLVNITFHTASGDVHFPLVKETFVSQVNYLLYKIETSTKAWM